MGNQCTRQVQQSKIVLRLFFPAGQDAPVAVHPTVCSFHNPATSLLPGRSLEGLCFLAPSAKMKRIAELRGQFTNFIVVIPFVQTQTLGFHSRRSGALHRNTLQGFPGQLEVIDVGSGDDQSHGNAGSVGQQTALGSALGAIRGVFPGFFPHPREPWSSHRPSTASPLESLSRPRIPGAQGSKTA